MSGKSRSRQKRLFDGEPTLGEVEAYFAARNELPLVGVDEAGRGPLAGPVVVAAVVLPDSRISDLSDLDDSKRLDEAVREALFPVVKRVAVAWSIQVIDAPTIDEINILQATLKGMRGAIDDVLERMVDDGRNAARIVIDGNMRVPWPRPPRCGVELPPQTPVIKGDRRSRNVAAASILAKVHRDRLLVEYDRDHPVYGFAQHKGYPTPAHRAAIAEHGPCVYHRRSFRGVKEHVIDDVPECSAPVRTLDFPPDPTTEAPS